MDIAKQANAVVKKVLEKLTEEKDIERFTQVTEVFNNASGMTNGNRYFEAMLKGWMVSQANNAVFTAWRRGLVDDALEAEFRALPSTEEAVAEYDKFEDELKKNAEALEDQRKAYMEKQKEADIFKAVLNGLKKEEAEKRYKEYMEQVSQAR